MTSTNSRSSVVVVLTVLLALVVQPAYGYDGCTVLRESFPGREAVQVSLDIALAGACLRHDACYRVCVGFPDFWSHKDTCDLLLFLELEGWCGAVSTAQELADVGISAEQFLGPCVLAMGFAYAGVQGPKGLAAYTSDQIEACNPCLNGQLEFDCWLQGGNLDLFNCSCTFGRCGVSLETITNCQMMGGYWEDTLCLCWGDGASPVIVDLGSNGFHLVGVEDGVSFDIDGDHVKERMGWTRPASDDAFLVLDRNRNGKIDDGLELFGNVADQPASKSANGFLALAMFDRPEMGGNGDGKLTAADLIFPELRLWLDADHDGVSTPGELSSLAARNLTEIDLDYKEARRRDPQGNEFRYRAQVAFGDHRKSFAYDVFFSQPVP
ncbi:MAG: hypothetical protein ACJ76Y_02970 [Thermoanaerobaculia bacterium]